MPGSTSQTRTRRAPAAAGLPSARSITTDPATGATPAPVGPYQPIVRAGDWLVCSGQLGLVDGALVEGVGPQTRQAIAGLERLLVAAGASLGAVVKTTVFLADMDRFDEMNAAYLEGFGAHRPARSAIGVAALPRGALVEIEAWALSPGA